jgi:uncharacterized protein (TIGR03435 family)
MFLLLVSPSVGRTQAFSNIVITPSASTDRRGSRLQVLPSGDLVGHAILTIDLLSLAYNVPENPSPRLTSLPEWTARQRFDIQAEVPVSLKLGSKEIATQKRTIELLVRKLLADRFGLVLHVRTERMPVYALSVAMGRTKLRRAAINSSECILDTSPEGCHSFSPGFGHPLNGTAVDMSDLAQYLENWTDFPVVNCTGRTGLFTIHSHGWRPMKLPPPPPGTAGSGAEFASLPSLSAVLGTLGLQLVQRQESLPLYTVVRIHRPNAND